MLEQNPEIAAHVQQFRDSRDLAKAAAKFTDEKREEYLRLRRMGKGHYTTCRTIGIGEAAVRTYLRLNPEFGQEVTAAEHEFLEGIEDVLFEKAKDGEFGPIKEVLSKRNREKWGDDKTVNVNHTGRIEIEAGPAMARIAALQERLEARALTQGDVVIDAEIVE